MRYSNVFCVHRTMRMYVNIVFEQIKKLSNLFNNNSCFVELLNLHIWFLFSAIILYPKIM